MVPWGRGSDRTAALDEMRGPPSKSRRHRTPASSLLDRRHPSETGATGETRKAGQTATLIHISTLSLVTRDKTHTAAARGAAAASQLVSRVLNLAYSVAEASASSDAPARRRTGTAGPRL